MQLTATHFLIVCPLIAIAGFVDSIAGGGGLISLPAYLLSGLPVHACIATNKLSSAMGTTLTTTRYARQGYIDPKPAAFCVAAALLGASFGARLALMIDDRLFRMLMLVILPLTALYVLRRKNLFDDDGRPPLSSARRIALCTAIALVVGAYDGFYGPGTGTFLILLLTRFARLDLRHANGLTKAINLASNIASLAVYLMNGQVVLLLGLVAGVFGLVGNFLGSSSFTKRGAAVARPVILLVLTVFFVRTVLELTGIA